MCYWRPPWSFHTLGISCWRKKNTGMGVDLRMSECCYIWYLVWCDKSQGEGMCRLPPVFSHALKTIITYKEWNMQNTVKYPMFFYPVKRKKDHSKSLQDPLPIIWYLYFLNLLLSPANNIYFMILKILSRTGWQPYPAHWTFGSILYMSGFSSAWWLGALFMDTNPVLSRRWMLVAAGS